jgi:hypothetical protein
MREIERLIFDAIESGVENSMPEMPSASSIQQAIEFGVEGAILSIFSDLKMSRAETILLITSAITEGVRQATKEMKEP